MRFSRILFPVFLLAAAPAGAAFVVRLKALRGDALATAEAADGRMRVDMAEVAAGLGVPLTVKDGDFVIENASGTVVVDPDGPFYRTRLPGGRKWKASGFEDPPGFSGPRYMVSLQDLPALFRRTFTYHLQKRELTEDADLGALLATAATRRNVTVRYAREGRKDWVSVEDAARALGVVVYAAQTGQYTLVMPDFSLLELHVGESWVYKKKARFKPLEDPILLLSGSPHATPETLSSLFDADLRWEPSAKALSVPARYGRGGDVKAPDRKPLTLIGYLPEPLRVEVEELSAYYQTPGPTYSTDAPELYESVRDFITNLPADPATSGADQWSGEAQLSLAGSAWGRPLKGGGRFEKVGTRSRLAGGSLQWGFPGFLAKAGREYLKLGDFNLQFDQVDHAALSHSNDAFGEGGANPEWKAHALAGEQRFAVFVSTEFLSQTVVYRQRMAAVGGEVGWRSGRQRLGLSVTQYSFRNRVREISADFNFFEDLFGDLDITVDPQTTQALASTVLTDRHDTSFLEADYKVDNLFQLTAAGAMSRHRDATSGDLLWDDSWRVGTVLGGGRRRIGVSHESVGPRYRSLGDPLRYQDRRITRVSPYLDISRPWKVYGELRREDYGAEGRADLLPFRSDFAYLGNILNFRRFELKALANHYDHSLYGRGWTSSLDYTQHVGRDSVEAGVGWNSQWFGTGLLYKQSYTARLGGQILRPEWKVGLSQEVTRDHYPFYKLAIWRGVPHDADRWQSATQVLGQWKGWEAMAQYDFEPRYYRQPEVLYTGYARIGWQPNDKKILNVFYAVTSLQRGLRRPEVWRAGLELTNDFY